MLTGTGAVQAGPALMVSFIVAAIACCFAALAYAEFSSTIPVAGSIYTYSYATLGELAAWIIGWDLMLEYGLATSAVSVGWSGYLQSLLSGFGISLPIALTAAPGALPGHATFFNLPAFLVMMAITALLSVGVKESTRVNNIMVAIKVTVVLLVIAVGVFHVKPANWHPFMPNGWSGVFGAAAVMFFAFIGFDSVSSAAEEVKNPKRDLPIGIISSLAVCAVLYVAVAAVVTGIVPSAQFANISHPVSYALQVAGQNWVAGFIDLGAVLGMLTVILVMSYGQTRVIYAMSRDGLLPARLSKRASALRDAVLHDVARRHLLRADRRAGAAQRARRADQHRHARGVLDGVDRRADPAPHASRNCRARSAARACRSCRFWRWRRASS